MQNGIVLEDFKDYTGDIQEIIDFIDKISYVSKDFPLILKGKRRVRLKLYFADLENNPDFAYSENHTIAINGLVYNDSKQAEILYEESEKQHHFVKGTTYKDVPYHELGHIICNAYKINPLTIAKKITNIHSTAYLIEFLKENLSFYSIAMNDSGLVSRCPFYDGAEIIAECFCAYYSQVGNSFANKYVEECKKIAKEDDSIMTKTKMSMSSESTFWLTDKTWYRINDEKDCFEILDSAPAKAKISFEIWSGKRRSSRSFVSRLRNLFIK